MLCREDTCYKGNLRILFANNLLHNVELGIFTGLSDLVQFSIFSSCVGFEQHNYLMLTNKETALSQGNLGYPFLT